MSDDNASDRGNLNNSFPIHKDVSILSTEQYGVGKYPIRQKAGYDAPAFQDSLIEFRFEVAIC